ncbi:MAG TPA: methyltransferase [Geminicoccaceae bacterium]|nr:methyltransferase [Geminicoccaceae bacterium]
MASPAEPELTEDGLLGGRLRFFQPRRGYRAAIDPVLLAAAVRAAAGETVLDAGVGTGAAALCLAARVPGCRVVGLEREPASLELGAANARANGLADRVALVAGDLLDPPDEIRQRSFDAVMTNPPYLAEGAGTLPLDPTRRTAHLGGAEPGRWVAACLARLRPSGRLTLIQRTDRLDAVLAALAGRAGDAVVFPLWPSEAAAGAKRVIVSARKAARGPLRLARGLVLHQPDGRFTPAAEAVLRDGAPLNLASPP